MGKKVVKKGRVLGGIKEDIVDELDDANMTGAADKGRQVFSHAFLQDL